MKLASYADFADLWLVLLACRANSWWGRGEQLRRQIGDLSYLLRRGLRRELRDCLSEVLGSEPQDEAPGRLTRTVFRNSWAEREIYWARLLASGPKALSYVRDAVEVEGLESLREVLRTGRGAVVWECPLGNRLLGRLALSLAGFRVVTVHGPTHGGSPTRLGQRVVRPLYRAAESRLPVELVDIELNSSAYIERLTECLRQNGLVCINGVGRVGSRFVEVRFLGRPHRFASGGASLALSTGAALIPALCFRDSSGRRRMLLKPPWTTVRGVSLRESQEQALGYCVGTLEEYVRRHPEQWTGWHETD